MGQNLSPNFSLKRLPPGIAHGADAPEIQFEQLIRDNHKPVHADFGANGEITSTGLAFEDYSRCQTRVRRGPQRTDVPEWAVDDRKMQKLIVAFIEKRAYFKHKREELDVNPPKVSMIQRANEAQRVLVAHRGKILEETMNRLCHEYVALKESPNADPKRLRLLRMQIKTADTQRRFDRHAAALVAAIGFLAYRCGLDSPAVGAEIGFSPMHVRRTLHRLKRCWEELQNPKPPKKSSGRPRKQ